MRSRLPDLLVEDGVVATGLEAGVTAERASHRVLVFSIDRRPTLATGGPGQQLSLLLGNTLGIAEPPRLQLSDLPVELWVVGHGATTRIAPQRIVKLLLGKPTADPVPDGMGILLLCRHDSSCLT